MGFFNRLFGAKSSTPTPPSDDDFEERIVPSSQPIEGPPEFVLAAEMQRAYWTYNAQEHEALEAQDFEQLGWRERLRLHHLLCLRRLNPELANTETKEKSCRLLRRVLELDSPYRPRIAMVWQGQAQMDQEPDLQGEFLNPSLTHLGCLEVYRLNSENQPERLDFVSFDELTDIFFAPPSMMRGAKLFYEGGRDEIVLVPMLYGTTWAIGNEYDRSGQMTRFIAHLDCEGIGMLAASGLGVGQQDFSITSRDGSATLFGLSSVGAISFPLDMSDPRFDAKARARRIDPDAVRKQMNG